MSTITLLCSGLAQPRRLSNGLATIRRRILAADESADVRTFSWRQYAEIPDIAARLFSGWSKESRLVLAAHSWGSTWCCQMANQLAGYAIPVAALLLADGVARPPRDPLVIPGNVKRLYAWYQTAGVIRGSSVSVTPATTFVVHDEVHEPHHRVDEWPAFQDAVFKAATEAAGLRVEEE